MSKIFENTRELFVKAMEGISESAAKIANSTKYKVTEVNLTTRRREILESFGKTCYDLWHKGTKFPPEVEAQLVELADIDEQINTLKAEHFAYLNPEVEKELNMKEEHEEALNNEIDYHDEIDDKILENSSDEILEDTAKETDENQK